MKHQRFRLIFLTLALLAIGSIIFAWKNNDDDRFVTYRIDPKKRTLKLYWKDDAGQPFKSILNLKEYLSRHKHTLLFAMNGGMFKTGNVPVGLFIQDQNTVVPIDTASGSGNFYLKPNGVFYITKDGKATICNTENFVSNPSIRYATQSGPMLVINGKLHPAFKQGSVNVNIRNGIGILPDGSVIFAMSKKEINFYDFAEYFKEQGCVNALYLDGFVSRAYLPEKNWLQTDGDFGVMIGVVEK